MCTLERNGLCSLSDHVYSRGEWVALSDHVFSRGEWVL